MVIYPNDHQPAHVHVIGTGYEAVFNLNCPAGPLRREIGHMGTVVMGHLETLCRAWEQIHGIA
jgi:hypothetical protein